VTCFEKSGFVYVQVHWEGQKIQCLSTSSIISQPEIESLYLFSKAEHDNETNQVNSFKTDSRRAEGVAQVVKQIVGTHLSVGHWDKS
jgi:hypothetical protein